MNSSNQSRKKTSFKILLSAFLLFAIISSSISVAFAKEDIASLLSKWFANKQEESITAIDKAIIEEQQRQTERLKQEIHAQIQQAEKQLDEFTKAEIEKRTIELQHYTDNLIQALSTDDSSEKEQILTEITAIMERAISEMDKLFEEKADDTGQ